MREKIFWVLCGLLGAGIAFQVAKLSVLARLHDGIFTALGGVVGFIFAPLAYRVYRVAQSRIERSLQRVSLGEMVLGASGLLSGLLCAYLLNPPLRSIPLVGGYLSLAGYLVLGYAGLTIAIRKQEELATMFKFAFRNSRLDGKGSNKILDTSVIIDGRIADICKTGFIEGTLIIPVFVLEELQKIADSSDTLKRNRGRRGLDILNLIQKELDVQVQIFDQDFDEPTDVDGKLVKLAKQLGAKLLTNDYNLNKIADLHGVKVLNINELANALKPMVLPGEDMVVQVIKDGKESGQGIAYLDDGTMIVIEGGRRHIGHTIEVMVTSVLQTAAGRMIFARPKAKALERAL